LIVRSFVLSGADEDEENHRGADAVSQFRVLVLVLDV
jgi:hypothetical protein